MAITVGTNSYVTLAEATAYAVNRADTEAWRNLTGEEKEQTLVSAADYLDTLGWAGTATDVVTPQVMAWPRDVTIYHPRYGQEITPDNSTVNSDITDAQIELAIFIFGTGSFAGGSGEGGVSIGGDPALVGTPDDIKVGSIELRGLKTDGSSTVSEGSDNTSADTMIGGVALPPVIYNLIKPWLGSSLASTGTGSGLYQPHWRAW